MWAAWARAGLAMAVLAFLMQVVRWIITPILDVAESGPHAEAETVTTISGWFAALTVQNMTLIAGIGIGIYVLGRAAAERRASV